MAGLLPNTPVWCNYVEVHSFPLILPRKYFLTQLFRIYSYCYSVYSYLSYEVILFCVNTCVCVMIHLRILSWQAKLLATLNIIFLKKCCFYIYEVPFIYSKMCHTGWGLCSNGCCSKGTLFSNVDGFSLCSQTGLCWQSFLMEALDYRSSFS